MLGLLPLSGGNSKFWKFRANTGILELEILAMTIERFSPFHDGLRPEQRQRHHFHHYTNLDDERLWVPYGDGTWIQPCQFNVTSGGYSVILKCLPGRGLSPHYHSAPVYGYTLRGTWRYLEHDWVALPGSFIYEPAGEVHTLVVPGDAKEPMMTFFVVQGGMIYVDKVEQGRFIGYDDGFTMLELSRKHYRATGLDLKALDHMIR